MEQAEPQRFHTLANGMYQCDLCPVYRNSLDEMLGHQEQDHPSGEKKKPAEVVPDVDESEEIAQDEIKPTILEHINEIDNPSNAYAPIKIRAVVSSSSQSYMVPKTIEVSDSQEESPRLFEIPIEDEMALRLVNTSDATKTGALRYFVYKQARTEGDPLPFDEPRNIPVEERETRTLYRLRVTPPFFQLQLGKDAVPRDEHGREYKHREIYVVADSALEFQAWEVCDLIGKAVADPRTQRITLFVWKKETVNGIHNYETTKILELKRFLEGKSVGERVAWILENFQIFSKIRKRQNLAFGGFLAYFSALYYTFEDQLRNGWLVILLLGDSTTGKSETMKVLIRLLGQGLIVTAETASMRGLTGAVVQDSGGTWFVDWGFLPLSDMKLLSIDGFQKLNTNESTSTDEAERNGIITIAKAGKGNAPARVRQVKIANPVDRNSPGYFKTKALRDFLYPAQALATVLNDTSIKRLDAAFFSDDRDVEASEINEEIKQKEDPLLHNLGDVLKLVWSNELTPRFEKEAISEILKQATEISDAYGWSGACVASKDMKFKIAKMSISLANLTCSFNESLTETIVTKDHVKVVAERISREYSLTGFAALKEKEESSKVTKEDAKTIIERVSCNVWKGSKDEPIFPERRQELNQKVFAVIEHIATRNGTTKQDLKAKFNLAEKNELDPLVSNLRNEEIIDQARGFIAAPKGIQLVKAMREGIVQ